MKKSVLSLVALMMVSSAAFANVDINTATQAHLAAVKAIGPVKAKSIIEYRAKHGNFKSVNELEKVPGFSHQSVSKLSKDLSVMPAAATVQKTPETTQHKK